jgi:hypothetical protein
MTDHSTMRLGKFPRRHDRRTLKMARYLTAALPPAPASADWTSGITDWGMMLNDQLGCCVLGDTLVNTADATLGYRSQYSGPIIIIKCLSGKKLAVTPNHAILTPRGFTPAKLIKQGDNLVSTRRAEVFPRSSRCGSETDLNQAPSPIEKICSSLNSGVNAASKIVPRSVHFHGDGQFINGDIDVIGTNGLLRSKLHGALSKPKCQYKISSARKLKRGLECLSSPFLRVVAGGPAPLGDMRLRNQRLNFMSRHARISKSYGLPQRSRLMTIFPKYFFKGFPAYACSGEDGLHRFPFDISRNQFADVSYFLPAAQVERLAPTANNYLSLTESPADGLSRNSDLFGELHDRNPGLIFQDRVIDVEIKELSTHVYDLATQCGYYVSNGIVTHNCTIAAIGHAIQTWTTASSQSLTVPDSTILEYYEKWDGYNPADPRSDQGGVELDILNDWRQQGFSGQSLEAYVAIELRDSGQAANRVIGRSGDRVSSENTGSPDQRTARSNDSAPLSIKGRQADQPITGSPDQALPEIATAIWLFGGAYIGVELPIRAQNQDVWDVPTHPGSDDEPGSWGGHAIYLVGYDRKMAIDDCRLSIEKQSTIGNGQSSVDNRQSTITCITWGRPKKMTWAWFQKYCSEAYALVSKAWLKASGVAPCGFDLATLEADLELVTT